MAFTPIDEEEIIDEPVAEEAKPRFIPIEDDEFFGIGEEEEQTEPVVAPETTEPVGAPKSRFTPISEEEFFGLPKPTEPIPVTGEEGFLRQAADVPLKIGESINTSLRALTDLFGADNAVSQNLTQNAEWYRSLLSAQALEDEQEIGRILQEAENEGVLDQLSAGLEAFSVAPVDFVASGIGSLATFAATGVLGRAAAVAGAARAGLTGARAAEFVKRGVQATQLATGAGMGAGIVKGEIYQSVKDEMLAQGKTEEEAKNIAMEAQSYMGKNLDQILLGAGLGTIDAFTGAEKILGKVLTKGGLKPDASRIGNIIKNGITEAVPEFVQAAQEKFASNLALRREGVDVSLTQGIFSQGALEGLVGLGLGVGGGAIEPRIQTEPTKEEVAAAASETQDVARQSMDVAPATASLVEGEAEQIIKSQAETPDERVARLQREAQEAAGEIELEEEVPVSGLPPVEPTPPATPTPEAAVAPVEPVVPAEGAVEPAVTEVAPEGTREAQDLQAAQERVQRAQEELTRVQNLPTEDPAVEAAFNESTQARAALKTAEVAARNPNSQNISQPEELRAFFEPLQQLAPLRPAEEPLTEGKKWRRGEQVGSNESVGTITQAIPPEGESNIVYRGVTKEDYERILASGQIDSDMRGAVTTSEGINLSPDTTAARDYLPRGEAGVVIAIDATGLDLNFIEADQYLRSFNSIPADRIVGRSDFIFRDAETGDYLLRPQDNTPVANEPESIVNYTKAAPEAAPVAVEPTPVAPPPVTLEAPATAETRFSQFIQPKERPDLAELPEFKSFEMEVRGVPVRFDIDTTKSDENTLYLESFRVPRGERRQGIGREAMTNVLRWADENNVTLKGEALTAPSDRQYRTPQEMREQGYMTPRELFQFYQTLGWERDPEGPKKTMGIPMVYRPKPAAEVAPIPQLEPLRRVARAEQTEEDVAGLVDAGFVEVYNGQPVITQAGLDALPEAERPRLTPEARKIQIDTRTSEAAAEAISKNLRIGVDQVPVDVRMPEGWTLVGDVYVPPQPQAVAPAPTPEVREARIERDPEVQKAAQDLRAGTINRDEYQRIVDMRMPLRKFEAVPTPATNDDMLRGLGERTIKRKDAAGNDVVIKKTDIIQSPESIAEGTVLEARLDIPAYESENVWVVSLHRPRPDLQKGAAAQVVAYTPTSVLRNVTFGVTEKAAAGIAAGKPKSTIATMRGEYVPMTAEQAYQLANTNKDQWVEIGMNPVRHSYFYDKDTQTPVESAEEVVQVGGMVLAKNPVFGKREDYLYARRVEMGRAGMETSAVEARLQELGFPAGGIIRVVNEPDADFEGRTIILDGKVTGIELNASAMRDNATIDRVLNHEFAESANADGALNRLVERLTPKEKKEINDTITRLRYEERARTAEEAARAIETLAEAWKGRGFFTRAVARVEAWASKLGFKLTRRAAEYIAARNLADINAGFKTAYNQFINVTGDERLSRAYKMGVPTQEELDARKARLPKYTSDIRQPPAPKEAERLGRWATIEIMDPNGRSVGRAIVVVPNDGDTALTIQDTIVYRQFRGLGYGEALYREVAKFAQQNGMTSIFGGIVSEDAQRVRRRLFETKYRDVTAVDNEGYQQVAMESNVNPDIRYARREVRESRREPEAIPTFTEGTPEAATLKEMATSMAKVDAASEAKGGKPETQKISEIASVWMDSGLGERELQDAIVEYTNLTPANAAKVAKAIARQYDIQQSIATAFLETPTGLSVEAIPEGATLPPEVDPDRPKPVMQRLFEVFMGVRVPPVKITGNEKTFLKQQIRLKAAANRAAKGEQQKIADAVVETIKQMELRGPVRPRQAQALAKRAAKVLWTSEKSVEAFTEYAAKVVENTNYDADLREAKAAQKRAKELSKQKKVAMSPQREILNQIGNVAINKLEDPRLFAETINYYLRGFKDVRSPEYVVVPDAEMVSYISQLETEAGRDQIEVERESNERLARKYDLDPDTIPELMGLINIIEEIEGRENREALEKILTDKAIETQEGLRGYDTTSLTNEQKRLVDAMNKVDLKSINTQERQMFIRIANNMIYNNQTNGAEYFVATAQGQQNAREAAMDAKLVQRNKAWIPLIPSFGSLKLEETLRNFSLELQSIADTFRNVFGKEFMAKAYEKMGMLNLNEGFTKANNTIDEIQDMAAEFHQGNEKKFGAAASDQDGILSEGVAGFLIQSFPFKDEATSIQQRRNLINEYITNARNSRQKPRVAMADRVEAILNKVDGNSVQEILNNLKREYPANHEVLMWYKDVLFPKYKGFLKQFDENFNDQANNYDSPNYLPISFTSAGPALAVGPEDVSIANAISLQPKQSVYTIKRQDYTTLPKDRDGKPKEIEFNLRRTSFNSLSDQINKAYTSAAWQQLFSFMKTPESVDFFGDEANRDFFVDRLNRLRASRARRGSVSGGALEKALDAFSIISRKLGTGIALGGAYQWIKQPPDQLITAWGSGGRGDLLAKNLAPSNQKLARELLNLFSIGRRGDSSAGYKYINQMEGHQSRMERYFTERRFDKAKEQAGKIADVWMIALKKSDFIAASAAWMTYYEGELNKNEIYIDDWAKEAELIKNDPVRREAAAFAENMTDIYQGSSDPTSMATFAQSGKTGWENFTKALLVPFNSFAIQQRMRLYSDARDALLGNKGGAGGLAGTIGGLILFHATKRYVIPAASGVGIGVLYSLMGVDVEEPDEEKRKEMADRNWRQFLADMTGNLLVGGTPQIVESEVIKSFNRASYLVAMQLESESVMDENGEIMSFDKYSKERSPFYRYQSYDNAMSLGMFDIGLDQAKETALQTKMLMDRDEMDMYTPEEQRLLYFSALSEWLLLMRLNDTDFARLVKKARRDMIKAAEDREKELQRIRSGR